MFGLPSNTGERLQAMRELNRRQAEGLVGEGAAFEVVTEAAGKRDCK